MHPPLSRSLVIPASLAGLILLSPLPAGSVDRTAGPEVPRAARADKIRNDSRGLSVTVRPGDSWEAVRGRMFPVQSLKQANPGLDPDLLHPGQVVHAPYVPAELVAREREARGDAVLRLTAARDRLAALERERAGFEAQRRDFARAGDALRALKGALLGLIAFAVILLAGLGVALQATRAARRRAAEEVSRRHAIESRYEGLRRSLAEIESGLQRRMMGLLHLHGGKIISEKEIDASVRPVIDLAGELRKKHGRA